MPEVPPPVVLQPFRFFFLPFLPFLHFFGFFLATTAGPPADSAGTARTAPARAAARTAIVILLTTRFTPDHSAVAPDDRSESPPARRTSVVTFRVIERHIFRVKNRRARADKNSMTSEQMNYRAQQAEHLLERFSELEREHESAGLYEEALEARRLRLEQEAAVSYWRDRATDTA